MIKQIDPYNDIFYEHDDKLYEVEGKLANNISQLIAKHEKLEQTINKYKEDTDNLINVLFTENKQLNEQLNEIITYLNLPWYKKIFFKFKINTIKMNNKNE